jgi:site-specific DNA-methyltransferase (adenine-specific)
MFTYDLTPRQREVLRFLVEFQGSKGFIPSVREVQKQFRFASVNSAAQHLAALEKKGVISRVSGKARAVQFSGPNNFANAPDGKALRVKEGCEQMTIEEVDVEDTLRSQVYDGTTARELDKFVENSMCAHLDGRTRLVCGDALEFMSRMPASSIHAIVTDPPYGLIEYQDDNHAKLRQGRGGVWRIPPVLDGVERSPLPRFTVLTAKDRENLYRFFANFGQAAGRVLRPGGHLIIASNPLLSTLTFSALVESGLEKRGEVIRLVSTLRGGDRPKGAESEFADISVMPRSCWEPWGLFRTPISENTVAENLRKHSVGGFRRISSAEPFKDLIECPPARGTEREVAPHPSLKPQRLMRYLVRASLPLEEGIVLDPFAGSGSTLAAAGAVGYHSIGIERDQQYFQMAKAAFPKLKALRV